MFIKVRGKGVKASGRNIHRRRQRHHAEMDGGSIRHSVARLSHEQIPNREEMSELKSMLERVSVGNNRRRSKYINV